MALMNMSKFMPSMTCSNADLTDEAFKNGWAQGDFSPKHSNKLSYNSDEKANPDNTYNDLDVLNCTDPVGRTPIKAQVFPVLRRV